MTSPQENEDQDMRLAYIGKMDRFKFRCHRAAMMNYYLAAHYDRRAFWLENVGFTFGAVTAVPAAVSILNIASPFFKFVKDISVRGLIFGGLFVAVTHVIGNGSTQLFKSYSQRAKSHNEAAATWQELEELAESYMIQMKGNAGEKRAYIDWYKKILEKRASVCAGAFIDNRTYNLFSKEKVAEDIKNREAMYKYCSTAVTE